MKLSQWVVIFGALWVLCPVAGADDPIGRISFGASGGFSSYALDAVNERISGAGNDFLLEKGWSTIDQLNHGWTFWSDLRIPIPLGEFELPVPFIGGSLPVELSVGGGYGVSMGTSGGDDYNELIEVEVSQTAYHARLFYTLPFRVQENTRMFLAGGPLFITDQEVTGSHTARSSAGGGGGTTTTERKEEVTYSGDGQGWQIGVAAEYMVQDRVTLSVDLGYRWASVDYGVWSSSSNVSINDTDTVTLDDGSTNLERLRREDSYVLRAFLDMQATEEGEIQTLGHLHEYGPHKFQLQELGPDDLDIDMSGLQVHIGFRLYFL